MIRRIWPGETVAILGGGPSLTVEDVHACLWRVRTIAVNNAVYLAPSADALHAMDRSWWRRHGPKLIFSGLRFSLYPEAEKWGATTIDHGMGRCSGHQAILIAAGLGASRILLLGFDAGSQENHRHWHGDHDEPLTNPTEKTFESWRTEFPEIVARCGAEVINCSRQTTLTGAPRMNLEDALNACDDHHAAGI